MKLKKLLCPLLAGAMLCGSAALPVAAEEATTYQMGDVDMNGVVDVDDAVLLVRHYILVFCVGRSEGLLTDEQIMLANVLELPEDKFTGCMLLDTASAILRYSVLSRTIGYGVTLQDVASGKA